MDYFHKLDTTMHDVLRGELAWAVRAKEVRFGPNRTLAEFQKWHLEEPTPNKYALVNPKGYPEMVLNSHPLRGPFSDLDAHGYRLEGQFRQVTELMGFCGKFDKQSNLKRGIGDICRANQGKSTLRLAYAEPNSIEMHHGIRAVDWQLLKDHIDFGPDDFMQWTSLMGLSTLVEVGRNYA